MRTTEMVLFAHFLKTSKFIPACISIYILSLQKNNSNFFLDQGRRKGGVCGPKHVFIKRNILLPIYQWSKIQNETFLLKGAPRIPISLIIMDLISQKLKKKFLDYFEPFQPSESVFNSLKIQNETFLLKGAPRIPISLTTLLMEKIFLDYFEP